MRCRLWMTAQKMGRLDQRFRQDCMVVELKIVGLQGFVWIDSNDT